jgi:hypothetical protein
LRFNATVGACPSRPTSSSAFEDPGSHCTNFSPIRLCGRIRHLASARNGANRSSIFICTRARRSEVNLTSSTSPTSAPAIFTSWPGIRCAAL